MEVCSPSGSLDAGPRMRERPLGRCHTLDTHTPNTTDYTPKESDETDVPETAGDTSSGGVQTTGDTDDAQPEMNETQSTDESNCTGSESSLSPPCNVLSHTDASFESPHTHTTTNHSASHEPDEPSDTNNPPVNEEIGESPDNQAHTEAESSLSESKDGNSNPTHPSDLQFSIQTDQTDANQTAEMSAESSQ